MKTAGAIQTAYTAGVALGVAQGIGPADFQLAVRIYQQGPDTGPFLRTIQAAVGNEAQIQVVGPLAGPRNLTPVYQQRHAVLMPGLSVSHFQSTAGTIGGFVRRLNDPKPDTYILSNNHVLANSNSVINPSVSAIGDPVLHPGPFDGGSLPQNEVAELSDLVQLRRAGNTVDGAIAGLKANNYDCKYDGHKIRGIAAPIQGQRVWKVGRTTSRTTGTIGATNVKFTGINYPFGMAFFDGVFEVHGEANPFSKGGDSGSLVLNEADEAVGLLFAGKDSDHDDPSGYTLVIPIQTVLTEMQLQLLG